MAIMTAEAAGVADVSIDFARCDACGLCVEVCPGAPLLKGEHGIEIDQSRMFGCIGCGQCMTVCPTEAIRVDGRCIAPEDVFPLSPRNARADFGPLLALMQARRSCRMYRRIQVPADDVDRILAAARTAPMGLPPSGVGVLVHHGFENVQAFRRDLIQVIRRRRWLFRAPAVWALRIVLSKARWQLLRSFVDPAFDAYLGQRPDLAPDRDWFFYDAPLALSFYTSETSDPADGTIAATHAMLAAEALGYGTCFLGFPGYLLAMDARLRRNYGLPKSSRAGVTLIIGTPHVRPARGIRRRFARVDWRYTRPQSSVGMIGRG
jgi:ferredoxin